MNSALRNLLISVLILALAAALASWVSSVMEPRIVVETMSNLWVVFVLLATVTTTLLFKLHDLSGYEGASITDNIRLDRAVARKMLRLWLLVTAFVFCAAIPRLPTILALGYTETFRAFVSVAASFIAVAYWFYVPFMWLELRQYRVAIERATQEAKRVESYIKAMQEGREEK